MAASPSSSCLVPLLLLFLAIPAEARPSRKRDDMQVLSSLFGSHLSSLIVAPATSDDAAEGSAQGPAPASSARGSAGREAAAPHLLLEALRRQAKMRRRGRTSALGGRGCFGMKMDRIGSVSGLGC